MTKLGARSALIAGGLAMPLPRSLFASNRAAAQSLITVSFSVTVNDQRIIISNPSWPPSTVTKSQDLTVHYPQRWHIEEFFKFNQALGWHRAGTLNLNIRYGQMTMALVAQAAIHQMRQRLGQPFSQWDASHLARELFGALEGDVRVKDDTIQVTYYNAPHRDRLRQQYENLPDKLQQEGIEPTLPWLYDFKLDFRFR